MSVADIEISSSHGKPSAVGAKGANPMEDFVAGWSSLSEKEQKELIKEALQAELQRQTQS